MAALPDSTIILIIGAGPTGLTTALSLLHRDFRDFVIVDAVSQGENTSRAIGIHSASLEALDEIGCGDDIVSMATKVTQMQIRTRTCPLICADFTQLKRYTRHPYFTIIPQNFIEHILGKKISSLGVTIHRPLKVVGMKRNAENAQLTDVTFEGGRVITVKYVVGADGARSTTRTIAGIAVVDPMSEMAESATNVAQIVLADVTFDAPLGGSQLEATLSPKSVFSCTPLPFTFNKHLVANGHHLSLTDQISRIGVTVPLEEGDIPHSPPKEFLQSLVDRFGPYSLSSDPSVNPNSKSIRIKDVIWTTRFRNHSAIADTFFTRLGSTSGESGGGVILLVGDAAHIHSPTGGQGLNLGMRDAMFLGEALTKHMDATNTQTLSEADAILLDFAAARHARALEVIGLTKGMTSIMGAKGKDWVFWWLPISKVTVRNWVLWLMGMFPFVRGKMAWELSGLGRR